MKHRLLGRRRLLYTGSFLVFGLGLVVAGAVASPLALRQVTAQSVDSQEACRRSAMRTIRLTSLQQVKLRLLKQPHPWRQSNSGSSPRRLLHKIPSTACFAKSRTAL
jgi:hypothetical protein